MVTPENSCGMNCVTPTGPKGILVIFRMIQKVMLFTCRRQDQKMLGMVVTWVLRGKPKVPSSQPDIGKNGRDMDSG